MYSWMIVASGMSLLYSWLAKYSVTGILRGVSQTREIAFAWQWGFLGVGIPKDFSTPSMSAWLHSSWQENRGVFHVGVIWSDVLMYISSMMFGWIIAKVFLAGLVVKFKIVLCLLSNSHKYCIFIAHDFLFDDIIDNADCCGVVNMYWGGWLQVTKLLKN
jgi:hypothetical protein